MTPFTLHYSSPEQIYLDFAFLSQLRRQEGDQLRRPAPQASQRVMLGLASQLR